jgi:UDP-N-acetylglucosamine 3-dehydrogenase
MESIRVGVIGVGSMGKNHVRIYSELRETELVGIADNMAPDLEDLAQRYETRGYTDYKELLSEGLDAVSIAVPTTMHNKVACDVLSKKVSVLLEKPIADTVENANRIIKASEENGCKLMIGHVERFNPIVPVIKRGLQNEEVIMVEIKRVGPLPPRIKDVGVMVDLGVHDIDLIRHLTGSEFENIYPLISSNITEKEDTAIVTFRMKNKTLALLTTDWLTPFKVREIMVSTKKKFIKGDFISQKVTEYSKYSADGSYMVRNLAVPAGEPLRLELASFIRSVREDLDTEVTGYDGLEALKVALNCLELSKK